MVVASRKLRRYFLVHPIIIRTNLPLRQILYRLDLAETLTKWVVDLTEFEISIKSRKALKAQLFVGFIAEMTRTSSTPKHVWVIFTDRSSNCSGSSSGIILENNHELMIEFSMRFEFPTTNN